MDEIWAQIAAWMIQEFNRPMILPSLSDYSTVMGAFLIGIALGLLFGEKR